MTKVIGLAGKPGSGKSAVAAVLASDPSTEVVDLDRIAWEVYAAGTETFGRIVDLFGEEIIGVDGEINRGELAVLVFLDPTAKAALEAIVHPAVLAHVEVLRADAERRDVAYLLVEGALLTVSPHVDAALFDAMIWLEASDATREARLRVDGRADHVARGDDLEPGPNAGQIDAEASITEVAAQVRRLLEEL